VKPSSELGKPRVREKLEIEHRYWTDLGVTWGIVTEHEINRTKAANIEWLAQAQDLGAFGLSEPTQSTCIEYFLINYSKDRSSLLQVLEEVEQVFDLVSGTGLNIFKYLAYWKRIAFNADEKFNLLGARRDYCYAGGTV
jgi:hypothetical protein